MPLRPPKPHFQCAGSFDVVYGCRSTECTECRNHTNGIMLPAKSAGENQNPIRCCHWQQCQHASVWVDGDPVIVPR